MCVIDNQMQTFLDIGQENRKRSLSFQHPCLTLGHGILLSTGTWRNWYQSFLLPRLKGKIFFRKGGEHSSMSAQQFLMVRQCLAVSDCSDDHGSAGLREEDVPIEIFFVLFLLEISSELHCRKGVFFLFGFRVQFLVT